MAGLASANQAQYVIQAGDKFNPYTGQALSPSQQAGGIIYNPTPAQAPAAPASTIYAPSSTVQQNKPQQQVTTPVSSPQPVQNAVVPQTTSGQTNLYSKAASYAGPSVVDFLSQAGQPSDYASRTGLAQRYGIQNYTGTAAQNTQLLNILKGYATGNVSSTGVPNTLPSAGTLPGPNDPIDAGNLSNSNGMVGKVLGANIDSSSTGSDIAGLLSLYGADTAASKNYQDISSKLVDSLGQLGGKGSDLADELDRQGVNEAYQQVKELNLSAARLKGELDSFDSETLSGANNIDNQPIPTGLISGYKAQYQKQRDLQRLSKASELSSTIALSQAYQGNAVLGRQLAEDAINMKYQPIQNEIDVLKTQLGIASDTLNRDDSNRSKIITALIGLKQNELDENKKNDLSIQNLAIQAASNGAPTSVVNAIKSASDPVSAAEAGAKWIKGNLETTTKNPGTTTTKTTFSETQLNKGAANASLPITEFKQLPADDQNFFVNSYPQFTTALTALQNGNTDKKTLIANINSLQASQKVKDILIGKVNTVAPDSSGGGLFANPLEGGFWNNLQKGFDYYILGNK